MAPGRREETTRLREGRIKPAVGAVRPFAEAPDAFGPRRHGPAKTIIRVSDE
ncbi:hypothetical protein [Nocardia colli]|uniref:hypothetical protein n=1 Tax=Nocardia colli TaxID=2545717 RepID=UPI00168CBAA8|nr:hypothetical protein [Nocardia colli]